MSKSIDAATRTIHLQGIGRVPVPAVDEQPEPQPVSGPPATVYGALAESLTVPQVGAALDLLTRFGQPLAALQGARCVRNGAYLDPRRDTGQVVLEYLRTDALAPDERDRLGRRMENARFVESWAGLFRADGWAMERYTEPHPHNDGRLTLRLVLTPPEK
jgi:hypothetical protein